MAITNSVPASTRRPGTFFEFNLASAARGLAPLAQRMALVGQQLASGSKAVATVNQVFSEADADAFYARGSELALMAKFALRGGRDFGQAAEVWAVGIADPAGVAATFTFTVTGTATASGEIVIRIAGRTIRGPVASGDVQNTIAAALKSSIDAQLAELPVSAAVVTNVVTITCINIGVNGNDIKAEVQSSVAGVTVVAAVGVAGTGTVDITASLDLLADKDYDVVACANHTATDISDFNAHLNTMFNAGTKRWRHTMLAERGTLATAQALATAANDHRQMVLSAEGFRNRPSELAAYTGMFIASEDDPALPFNNVELPELSLPDAADVPTNTEIESGIAGGLFVLSANEQQTRAKIVRAVTTRVTLNAVPFFATLDVTITRSLFFTARQIDIAQRIAFPRAKKSLRTKRAVRALVLATLEQIEDLEIVQNVDAHAGELVVEDDPTNPDRLNVAIPASIVPPLNQVVNVVNLLLE